VAFVTETYAWFVGGDWRVVPFGDFRPANLDRIADGLNRVFDKGAAIPELRAYLTD
jgi:hypothetical protein